MVVICDLLCNTVAADVTTVFEMLDAGLLVWQQLLALGLAGLCHDDLAAGVFGGCWLLLGDHFVKGGLFKQLHCFLLL